METVTPPEPARSSEQLRTSVNIVYGFVLREHLKDIAREASPADLEKSRQVAVDLGEHGLLGGKLAESFIKDRGGQQFRKAQEDFPQAKTPQEKLALLERAKYLNRVKDAYQQLAAARQTPGNIAGMIPEIVRNPSATRIISQVDADRLRIGNEAYRIPIVKAKLAEALAQAGEIPKLPLISSSSGLKIEYELTPQMMRELAEILKPRPISDALETNVGLREEARNEDSAVTVNPSQKIFNYTKLEGTENKVFRKTVEGAGQSPLEQSLKSLVEQGIGLWAVADGMGGAAAGEIASAMALERLVYELAKSQLNAPGLPPEEIMKRIVGVIGVTNQRVFEANRAARNDMGSTLAGVIKVGETAYIFNVGDSRVYLLREGEPLRKITRDHSLVQALVDSGQISEDEVRTHPQRNIILRNIGDKPVVQADIFTEPTKPGDQFIICCDGLWELMQDADIQRIVSQKIPESEKVRQLVELANKNGGDDNITVVIAKF